MKVMTMIALALSNKLLVEEANAQYAHFSWVGLKTKFKYNAQMA